MQKHCIVMVHKIHLWKTNAAVDFRQLEKPSNNQSPLHESQWHLIFFCTWLSQGIRRPKKKPTLNQPICSNGIYLHLAKSETREMNLLPTLFLLLRKLGQLDGWFRNWLFTYQGGAFLPESLNNMFIQWQVFPSIYLVENSQCEWNHHLEIDYLQNLCLQIARNSGLHYSRFRLVNRLLSLMRTQKEYCWLKKSG